MPDANKLSPEAATAQLAYSIEEARRLTVEVTLSDLELAVTFLETARASRDPRTIERCHRSALAAFLEAIRSARNLRLVATAEQRTRMDQLLESIRIQLAGYYRWAQGSAAGRPRYERCERCW